MRRVPDAPGVCDQFLLRRAPEWKPRASRRHLQLLEETRVVSDLAIAKVPSLPERPRFFFLLILNARVSIKASNVRAAMHRARVKNRNAEWGCVFKAHSHYIAYVSARSVNQIIWSLQSHEGARPVAPVYPVKVKESKRNQFVG